MEKVVKKKDRFLELDILRVIAIILIYLQHLFHLCIPNSLELKQCGSFLSLMKLSPGEMGVSLFLFLSGITLTRFSIKNKSIKEFYIGRFLRLYLPFWLVYFPTLIYFLANNLLPLKIKFSEIVLSFTGLAGYFGSFIQMNSWYILGEWFFGFIAIIYIIYPTLFYLFNKNRYLFLLICFLITFASTKFESPMLLRTIPARLMEFSIGMFFGTLSFKKNSVLETLLLLAAVIINDRLLKYGFMFIIIKLIITDVLFYYLANIFQKTFISKDSTFSKNIRSIIVYLSEISFAFFLVHHVVIIKVIGLMNKNKNLNALLGTGHNIYVYISLMTLISIVLAHFVFKINKIIIKKFIFENNS